MSKKINVYWPDNAVQLLEYVDGMAAQNEVSRSTLIFKIVESALQTEQMHFIHAVKELGK